MATTVPNDNQALRAVLGVFGTFAGLAAAVYVFGGIVLLLRLESRGLRGEVVVASLPREFLISVGLAVLFQFLFYILLVLGAFVQQAVDETRMEHAPERIPTAIRVGIVGLATAVLAVPLTRWIGFDGVPWWWGLTLAYGLYVAFSAFWVSGRWDAGPLDPKVRWGAPLSLVGIACVVIGLVALFEFEKPLALLVVLLAAVLTAVCLWLLLRRLVDEPGVQRADRALLRRAALVTLVAFVIFVPWRVALEAASIKGLNVHVCTSNPAQFFNGLFIGENDNSVFVGEPKRTPRIAEIPRDQVTRIFLGTQADKLRECPTPSN